jgi:hypothetical protein
MQSKATGDPQAAPVVPGIPGAERLTAWAATSLSVAAWAGAFTIIVIQVAAAPMGSFSFALCICWLVNIAGLGAGLGLLGGAYPRQERALTAGLNLGDPRLDEILVPGRRHWRARWRVRRSLGQIAAVSWTLSTLFTAQLSAAAYGLPHIDSVAILQCTLAAGVMSTLCAAAGSCDARREAAFNLLVDAHQRCRADCRRLAELAESNVRCAGDPPTEPLWLVPEAGEGSRAYGA